MALDIPDAAIAARIVPAGVIASKNLRAALILAPDPAAAGGAAREKRAISEFPLLVQERLLQASDPQTSAAMQGVRVWIKTPSHPAPVSVRAVIKADVSDNSAILSALWQTLIAPDPSSFGAMVADLIDKFLLWRADNRDHLDTAMSAMFNPWRALANSLLPVSAQRDSHFKLDPTKAADEVEWNLISSMRHATHEILRRTDAVRMLDSVSRARRGKGLGRKLRQSPRGDSHAPANVDFRELHWSGAPGSIRRHVAAHACAVRTHRVRMTMARPPSPPVSRAGAPLCDSRTLPRSPSIGRLQSKRTPQRKEQFRYGGPNLRAPALD